MPVKFESGAGRQGVRVSLRPLAGTKGRLRRADEAERAFRVSKGYEKTRFGTELRPVCVHNEVKRGGTVLYRLFSSLLFRRRQMDQNLHHLSMLSTGYTRARRKVHAAGGEIWTRKAHI